MTMQPPYDDALRDAVRIRMSPPNRESVAQIARDTGITAQTIYKWRSQWQKQGQLVHASCKPPEQWSAADKLAAVIQAARPSGSDLGRFCRERGLYPRQVARWRQAAEDTNGPSAPIMASPPGGTDGMQPPSVRHAPDPCPQTPGPSDRMPASQLRSRQNVLKSSPASRETSATGKNASALTDSASSRPSAAWCSA